MKLFDTLKDKMCIIILDAGRCQPGNHMVQGKPKMLLYSEDGAIYWAVETQIHQRDQQGGVVGSMAGTAYVQELSIVQVVRMEERSGLVLAGNAA